MHVICKNLGGKPNKKVAAVQRLFCLIEPNYSVIPGLNHKIRH